MLSHPHPHSCSRLEDAARPPESTVRSAAMTVGIADHYRPGDEVRFLTAASAPHRATPEEPPKRRDIPPGLLMAEPLGDDTRLVSPSPRTWWAT